MRTPTRLAGVALIAGLSLTACSQPTVSISNADPTVVKTVDAALMQLKGQVLSKGPHGEAASPASSVQLSTADIAAVRSKHLKAAIVLHYGGNDWANAQVAGLKDEFAKLGVTIVAITDANFSPDRQVSDLQTVMARKPDIIVSIPTDPVATASAYKAVAAAGVKLVFMDNAPQGMTAGHGYVSVVSADNYGNGVTSAYLMARAMGGKGQIGLIHHEADFFVTKQRYEGFKTTLAQKFPGIKVVADKGIAGPDFAGDAQAVANAMIAQHPDLKGIWAVWDVPAEGVMAAARAGGRADLLIATEDLGKNVAIAMAKNQMVVGLGAQLPFDQGTTEAQIAAGAVLGKKEPAYVALSSLAVTHANVLDAWKRVYHAPVPADLKESYVK